jgi:hypothetical protein
MGAGVARLPHVFHIYGIDAVESGDVTDRVFLVRGELHQTRPSVQ